MNTRDTRSHWQGRLSAAAVMPLFLWGCVTEESSAPSAALFPGSHSTHPAASADQGSTPPAGSPSSGRGNAVGTSAPSSVPSSLARARPAGSESGRGVASRADVEIQVLYGGSPIRDKMSLPALREAFESGYFEDKATGKRLYRIQTLYQAQQILQHVWAADHWKADSELARRFKEVPNASVTIVGEKDQRILFFDETGRLQSFFPPSGGGQG